MKKRIFSSVLAVSLITATLAVPIFFGSNDDRSNDHSEDVSKAPTVIVEPPKRQETKSDETIVKNDEKVTFIIEMSSDSLLDTVLSSEGKYKNVAELVVTNDGKVACDTIKKNQAVVKASIQKLLPDSDFSDSRTYYAMLNGFSVQAPLSTKEKIEKINGVKKVYISDTFLYTEAVEENIASIRSVSQTTKNLMNVDTDYDGSGMLIAVIDSEFDTMHEVFSVEPSEVKYSKEDVRKIYDSVGFGTNKKYSADDLYQSDKMVYVYDYAENDNSTLDRDIACHGTHIAALAAGNNGKEDENAFHGIAFNAQLALMKTAKSDLPISIDTVLSALDDCTKLGVDIVNISLGNERITECDIFQDLFEKLAKTGTVVICPAGNMNYNDNTDKISTYDIDYGTLNFLASDNSTFSVASSTNTQLMAEYLTADGNDFLYSDIFARENDMQWKEYVTEPTEYIYLEKEEDGTIDYTPAENKIAVLQYDEEILESVTEQASLAGVRALALIHSGTFEENAYNNSVTIATESIPIIFLDDGDSLYFEYNPEGIIETGENAVLIDSEKGNTVSEYSSWGVTPDLKLKPEITTVGENVYSASSDGEYQYLSGTSVSTALVSGAYALTKQYLLDFEWFNELSPMEQSKIITAVMMSNSEPAKEYTDEDVLYISPRKQGAGRVDMTSIMQSGTYLEVVGNDKPKAELGDSEIGEYEFTLEIHNISALSQTFIPTYYIQTDKPEIVDGEIINTLEPYSLREFADVEFFDVNHQPVEEITVESGETTEIHVTIQLDGLNALRLTQYFPNGFYVDGYVVLENQDGRTLNLPFMGFCGQWDGIDPFDRTIYDNLSSVTGYENTLIAVDYYTTSESVTLGKNLFTSQTDGEKIIISKNTVGNYYDISQLKNAYILPNFHLLRDVYDFTVSISDLNGKQLFSHYYGNINAKRKLQPYEQLIADSGELAEFFSKIADGEYIYKVSARTMNAFGQLSKTIYSRAFPFTVDNRKPENLSSKTYESDGKIYLALTAKDNRYLQGFALYTAVYNDKTTKYEYADKLEDLAASGYISNTAYRRIDIQKNKDGSVTHIYDITDLYGELTKLQFMTRGRTSPFSVERIAYRAYDGAYNSTDIKTADAVVYQETIFTFIDQNSKSAQGISVSLGDKTAVSDKDGQAKFDHLLPNFYLAQITDMPEGYHTDEKYFLIEIGFAKDNDNKEILLQFDGEYPEVSEESEEVSLTESSAVKEPSSEKTESTEDDPFYAILFVGILLFISAISLIVSRQRRKI